MAFGIPNSDGGSGGEFLGRIQYDARSGFFKVVKRVQTEQGYGNEESQPMPTTQFAIDFGTLEVGYSKIASPPMFLVAAYGQPVPPQPEEMSVPDPKTGNTTKAFKPCFRVKVCSVKTFGDGDAYYFSSNSKGVLGAVDALHNTFLAHPEAAAGKIPVVQIAKSLAIKTTGKHGTSTNYAPEFTIMSWIERPAIFGDRTVAIPASRSGSAPVAAAAAPAAQPARHVPPPTQPVMVPNSKTSGIDTTLERREAAMATAGAEWSEDAPF